MENNDLPIIQLQIRQAARTLTTRLIAENQDLANYMTNAINELISDQNIQKTVSQIVFEEFSASLEYCIKDYFRYGEGRTAIRESIKHALGKMFKEE